MTSLSLWNKYFKIKDILEDVDSPEYIYEVPDDTTFIVFCVSNKSGQFSLTVSKLYAVTKIRFIEGTIYRIKLVNDVNEECWYGLDLFDIPESCLEGIKTDTCGDCGCKFDINQGGDIIRETIYGKEIKRVCRECRYNYSNCNDCYHTVLKEDLSDYSMIKDHSMPSKICKRCLDNRNKSGKFVRCESCNRFTYKKYDDLKYLKDTSQKALCYKCNHPTRIVVQKIFNKNFFNFIDHEDRECTCSEEIIEDGGCQCGCEDDEGLYNNNINPLKSKTTDKVRTIGIELEVIPKEQYGLLKACQLLKADFHKRKFEGISYDDLVVVKEDGSLSRGGIEFNTTIFDTSPKKLKLLREMIDTIDKYFTADKSCGLHLHLGAKDLSDKQIKAIYWLYCKLESSIHKFVKSNRIRNRYCLPIEKFSKSDFDKISSSDLFEEDRYKAFNFAAYNKYGTIEIRLMEGTTNSDKILEWVDLHNRIFKYAIKQNPKAMEISKKTEKVVKSVLGNKLYKSYNNKKRYDLFQKKYRGN